jgi:programmed cell death 8 (apoptosis-inducing factor)
MYASDRRTSDCPAPVLRSNRRSSQSKYKAYRYVIIGAGTAANSAVKAIRETDTEGEILLLGDAVQKALPYHKPPLSGELHHKRKTDMYPTLNFTDVEDENKELAQENAGDKHLVKLAHRQARSIDYVEQLITLDNGQIYEFDSCLIATGGAPKLAPYFRELGENVMSYRTMRDFQQLKDSCQRVKSVAVVGGGLLATELASSIASELHIKVYQIFTGPGIYSKLLPRYLSDYITEESRKSGVDVRRGFVCDCRRLPDDSISLILDNGGHIDTEFVVVCTGAQPNVEIAKTAGLPIHEENGGIIVGPTLEVSENIFAAGDVISWHDPIFKNYRRIDWHDHSLASGHIAGKNMAGEALEYHHQPFFWSDLGIVGFEAVGLIDSNLPSIGVWATSDTATSEPLVLLQDDTAPAGFEFKKGFVYYLQRDYIVGILLVGIYGKIEESRAMIIQRRFRIEEPEQCKNLLSFEDKRR